MFKLNVINKISSSSAYMIDSCTLSLWHNRLSHVNTNRLSDMSSLNLIRKFNNDMHDRCKVCAQTKIIKIPFPKIDRTSTLLQLIHRCM